MFIGLADWLFDPTGLTPHGFCLLWEPGLIWLYALSDAGIGLAYVVIPLIIFTVIRLRSDLLYRPLFGLFAAFILLCGTGHWLDLLTLWVPAYGIEGIIKAATAITSIVTAITLWTLVPQARQWPSPAQLRAVSVNLFNVQQAELRMASIAREASETRDELARELSQREAAEHQTQASEARYRILAETLREVNERLSLATNTGGIGIWDWDVANDKMTWDASMYRLYGLEPRDDVQAPDIWLEHLHPDDRHGAEQTMRDTLERDKPFNINFRIVRSDGSVHHIHDAAQRMIRDETGRLIRMVGISMDISQHQTAVEQRAIIMESSPNGMMIVDETGTITLANARMEEIFDYPRGVLVGQSVEVLVPEGFRATHSVMRSKFTSGQNDRPMAVGQAFTGRKRDGSPVSIEILLNPVKTPRGRIVVASLFDVTERERNEAEKHDAEMRERLAIEKTNAKLEALINASPFAIVCLDSEQCVILWNAAAEQMFGYAADDVLNRPYPLVVPEDRDEFERRFKRLAAGEVIQNVASRRRHQDGRVIETSSSAAAFYDTVGTLLGIIFAIEDTRERTRVQHQLQQSQKMEAIGQLTGGLAHDFNNLLAIIHGNLELLGDQDGLAPLATELIGDALQATKRGANLTHRLLAYSGQQQLAPRTVDVGALVTSIIGMLRRVVEETIRIETDIASGLWMSRIDPQQLENALLNLTINARDAMPDGGVVAIAAENLVLDGEESEQYLEVTPGRYVLVSVSDTGIGMEKAVLERVLEPFFTTKPIGKGSGLGLSMVYGFVKQSGGHLTIYSEPGLGTCVKLYLPQVQAESADVSIEADTVAAAGSDERVILVVEDEASVRKLQVRVLGSLGYRTLEAEDGPSGLAILNGAACVDLLLTDIVLPGGMSGPALAEAARGCRPDLKVLFMSGYAPITVSDRYGLSGIRVLSKPFARSVLAQAVHELLEERISE